MSLPDAGGVLDRGHQIGLSAYWKKRYLEYNANDDIIYIGKNARINAGDEESSWAIWKFFYTGDNLTQIQGPLTGAWDDRATLAWT